MRTMKPTGDQEDCRERPGATWAIVAEIQFEGLPTRRRIDCGSGQRYQLTKCEAAADGSSRRNPIWSCCAP